jgi:hypothetical protein
MNRPPLRLARPGQLPAPATSDDSRQVLTEAIDQLARLRTPYWLGDSAVRLHALTSLIAQAQQLLPTPSTTPATRNSPGTRSASSSAPPPPPQHATTGTSHDQLDNDHRHNAVMRYARSLCLVGGPAVRTGTSEPRCRAPWMLTLSHQADIDHGTWSSRRGKPHA